MLTSVSERWRHKSVLGEPSYLPLTSNQFSPISSLKPFSGVIETIPMDLFKTDAVEQLLPLRFVSAISRPTVLFGFACAFLFFQLLIWTVRYSRKNTKPLANIPGPSGWPIIGIGLDLPARPRQLLNRWAAQYGDTFKVRVGWYNWVFFNSPDAVKEVFDRQVIPFPKLQTPSFSKVQEAESDAN